LGTTFIAVTVSTFFYFAAVGVLLPVLPRLVRDGLAGSKWQVGLMTTVYSAAAVACRPFLSWFTRRFGRRLLLLWGALFGAVCMAATIPVHSVTALLVLRVTAGVAEAMFFVGSATIVTELAPAARRAEATSYNSVGVFTGIGLGPVLGDWIGRDGHFGRAFAAAALCALAAFLIGLAVEPDRPAGPRPLPPMPSRPMPSRPTPSPRVESEPGTSGGRRRRAPLAHPGGLATGSALALAIAGYAGWSAFLALRADEIGHVNAGSVYLLYSVLTLAFRLLGAKVPERVGIGRCGAASFVMFTLALGSAALVDGAPGLWISAVLMSVGVALLYPSLLALTVAGVDDAHDRAAVITTFTMFFEVGGALGGVVLGQVAQHTSYQGAFGAGAVIGALGLPVMWFAVLAPRRRAQLAAASSA
jgi:MFS family permease